MAKQNVINRFTQDLTIDPGASGDSYVQFDINTTNEFRIGVDDDAADAFKISQGGALGANDTLTISAAGEVNLPLTPAFLAVLASTISNVTGDGTSYTVVWDTEVFDQNADFNGTTTFTAPVTGKYRLEISILSGDLAAGHNNSVYGIVTSNRTYYMQCSPGTMKDASNQFSISYGALADMDAADTATTVAIVYNGAKVVDIVSNGATDPRNWFSGNLEV